MKKGIGGGGPKKKNPDNFCTTLQIYVTSHVFETEELK